MDHHAHHRLPYPPVSPGPSAPPSHRYQSPLSWGAAPARTNTRCPPSFSSRGWEKQRRFSSSLYRGSGAARAERPSQPPLHGGRRAGPWLTAGLREESGRCRNSVIKVLSPGSTENVLWRVPSPSDARAEVPFPASAQRTLSTSESCPWGLLTDSPALRSVRSENEMRTWGWGRNLDGMGWGFLIFCHQNRETLAVTAHTGVRSSATGEDLDTQILTRAGCIYVDKDACGR